MSNVPDTQQQREAGINEQQHRAVGDYDGTGQRSVLAVQDGSSSTTRSRSPPTQQDAKQQVAVPHPSLPRPCGAPIRHVGELELQDANIHDFCEVCQPTTEPNKVLVWDVKDEGARHKQAVWQLPEAGTTVLKYSYIASLQGESLSALRFHLEPGFQLEFSSPVALERLAFIGDPSQPAILIFTGKSCAARLSGVHLQNCTLLATNGAQVNVTGSELLASPASDAPSPPHLGAYADSAARLTLTQSTISKCTAGVVATGAAELHLIATHVDTIQGNAAEAHGGAQLALSNSTLLVAGASSKRIPVAVLAHSRASVTIASSDVSAAGIGVHVDGEETTARIQGSKVHACSHTGILIQAGATASLTGVTVRDIKRYQGIHVRELGSRAQMVDCEVLHCADACVFVTAAAQLQAHRTKVAHSSSSQGVCATDTGTVVQLTSCTVELHYETCVWAREGAKVRLLGCGLRQAQTCQCLQVVDGAHVEVIDSRLEHSHDAVVWIHRRGSMYAKNSTIYGSATSQGLQVRGTDSSARCVNVTFSRNHDAGILVLTSARTRLFHCTVAHNQSDGIRVHGPDSAAAIVGCVFEDCAHAGLALDMAWAVIARGCTFRGCGTHGVAATGGRAYVSMEDCTVAGSRGSNVLLQGGASLWMRGGVLEGSVRGDGVEAGDMSLVRLENTMLQDNCRHGLQLGLPAPEDPDHPATDSGAMGYTGHEGAQGEEDTDAVSGGEDDEDEDGQGSPRAGGAEGDEGAQAGAPRRRGAHGMLVSGSVTGSGGAAVVANGPRASVEVRRAVILGNHRTAGRDEGGQPGVAAASQVHGHVRLVHCRHG